MSEIHIPLDSLRELRFQVSASEFNGIESDPKISKREPTLQELKDGAAELHRRLSQIPTASNLVS